MLAHLHATALASRMPARVRLDWDGILTVLRLSYWIITSFEDT